MTVDKLKEEILNKLDYNNVTLNRNFYTFEGIDGSGKTTIINKVYDILRKDYKVFISSEPACNNYKVCQEIMKLIYNISDNMVKISSKTSAFLFATLRNEHVINVLLPKIKQGYIVLCDRYIDSSLAYQGLLGNDINDVCALNKICINNLLPKKTFLLSLSAQEAIKRIKSRNIRECNSLDFHDIEYYNKINSYYDVLSNIFDNRIIKINNNNNLDLAANKISDIIIKEYND